MYKEIKRTQIHQIDRKKNDELYSAVSNNQFD
jgi:hypothetical protein